MLNAIMPSVIILCDYTECNTAEYHYVVGNFSKCHDAVMLCVMLIVILLNVIFLNVIMLDAVMLDVVMLDIVL